MDPFDDFGGGGGGGGGGGQTMCTHPSTSHHFDRVMGSLTCGLCGQILSDQQFEMDPMTSRANTGGGGGGAGAGRGRGGGGLGSSLRHGSSVRPTARGSSLGSHAMSRPSIDAARRQLTALANKIGVPYSQVEIAAGLYKRALNANVISGARSAVLCACLYAVCRRQKTAHLIHDFSDVSRDPPQVIMHYLKVICKATNTTIPPLDPSFCIARFASSMNLGALEEAVVLYAVKVLRAMSHDWINTGRRPLGVCAAALAVACETFGVSYDLNELVSRVRLSADTILRRVFEFSKTSAGQVENVDDWQEDDKANPHAFEVGNSGDKLDSQARKDKAGLQVERMHDLYHWARQRGAGGTADAPPAPTDEHCELWEQWIDFEVAKEATSLDAQRKDVLGNAKANMLKYPLESSDNMREQSDTKDAKGERERRPGEAVAAEVSSTAAAAAAAAPSDDNVGDGDFATPDPPTTRAAVSSSSGGSGELIINPRNLRHYSRRAVLITLGISESKFLKVEELSQSQSQQASSSSSTQQQQPATQATTESGVSSARQLLRDESALQSIAPSTLSSTSTNTTTNTAGNTSSQQHQLLLQGFSDSNNNNMSSAGGGGTNLHLQSAQAADVRARLRNNNQNQPMGRDAFEEIELSDGSSVEDEYIITDRELRIRRAKAYQAAYQHEWHKWSRKGEGGNDQSHQQQGGGGGGSMSQSGVGGGYNRTSSASMARAGSPSGGGMGSVGRSFSQTQGPIASQQQEDLIAMLDGSRSVEWEFNSNNGEKGNGNKRGRGHNNHQNQQQQQQQSAAASGSQALQRALVASGMSRQINPDLLGQFLPGANDVFGDPLNTTNDPVSTLNNTNNNPSADGFMGTGIPDSLNPDLMLRSSMSPSMAAMAARPSPNNNMNSNSNNVGGTANSQLLNEFFSGIGGGGGGGATAVTPSSMKNNASNTQNQHTRSVSFSMPASPQNSSNMMLDGYNDFDL